MDIDEILEKIHQYLPIEPEQYVEDYMDKLEKTITNCYEKEEYQMAYFNIYLIFMTYIYIVIYQISILKSKEYLLISEYIRAYNGRSINLNNIENIFKYSEIPDKEILKILALIDIDRATIGKYKGLTENRDPMAHATGYYVINTLEEFEIKVGTLLDYFEEINEKLLTTFEEYYKNHIIQQEKSDELITKLDLTIRECIFIKELKTKKLTANMKKLHEKILVKVLMNLYDYEVVYENKEWNPGYGTGDGDIEYREYKCPCGNGKIIEEHENIPGFRDHDVYICCDTCSKFYKLDTSKGTKNWKVMPKTEIKS